MIWDVSHQTYTHKLLTGRNTRFDGIRLYKGLCGFSHPKESPHDHFYCGHAGTALSLALGVAKNRDLTKRQEYVIPIIGDATLTCGVSLEALNNIQRDLKRFIVILNDNNMSISHNVGAITRILSRMINNPTVNKLYHDLDAFVSKMPYGATLSKQGHKIAESLKNLVSPAAFFEQYGLSYIGPIDGHDVSKLIDTLEAIKGTDWPIVVHVLTNKGQGMGKRSKILSSGMVLNLLTQRHASFSPPPLISRPSQKSLAAIFATWRRWTRASLPSHLRCQQARVLMTS
jgi:1-deoxy-D-xylulose-5-phosphate synthase